MTVTLPCPRCGRDLTAHLTATGGDLVPWGSTWVRLPSTFEVAWEGGCACLLSDEEVTQLEEDAITQASEPWTDDDPYGGDGPDD